MGIGVMDDGKGVLQVKERNNGAGYADLLLNPVSGNVGIGTNAPSAKLDVAGNIKSNGKSVPVSEEDNLRIVRGRISWDGRVLLGTGFTVVRQSQGIYTVTFSPAFSGEPVVTATLIAAPDGYAIGVSESTASSTTFSTKTFGTSFSDLNINFIAIGPR